MVVWVGVCVCVCVWIELQTEQDTVHKFDILYSIILLWYILFKLVKNNFVF